jgi:hypothetical protein
MTPEHKQKISDANKSRYLAMTDAERQAWQDKRQEGRKRTFALLKQLRERTKQ